MNSEQISQTVSQWVEEESYRGPVLPVTSKNNPWFGMSEEEIDDRENLNLFFFSPQLHTHRLVRRQLAGASPREEEPCKAAGAA